MNHDDYRFNQLLSAAGLNSINSVSGDADGSADHSINSDITTVFLTEMCRHILISVMSLQEMT